MHATQRDWASEWGVLDPMILFTPGSWAQLQGATGNWDGVRTDLSDAGVSVFGSYESESAGNPVGGAVHKFRYTHNIALGIALDLHRLLGLDNTYFLASASERTGNSLSNDIPNTLQVQQIYGHQTIRLVDLALEHLFFNQKLDVVGGRINALDDFATSPYYCFAQNLGFCGNPLSISTNAYILAIRVQLGELERAIRLTPEFYTMTGAYNTYRRFPQR